MESRLEFAHDPRRLRGFVPPSVHHRAERKPGSSPGTSINFTGGPAVCSPSSGEQVSPAGLAGIGKGKVKTLFQEIVEAGIPYSNHESDLYVPVTEQTTALIVKHDRLGTATTFRNQRPPNVGERWYDLPFAYEPFWEARQKRA